MYQTILVHKSITKIQSHCLSFVFVSSDSSHFLPLLFSEPLSLASCVLISFLKRICHLLNHPQLADDSEIITKNELKKDYEDPSFMVAGINVEN